MKRVSKWRVDRVDMYADVYRWIIIELIKTERKAMHRCIDG
jgi:hypothetical protein